MAQKTKTPKIVMRIVESIILFGILSVPFVVASLVSSNESKKPDCWVRWDGHEQGTNRNAYKSVDIDCKNFR